jgi:hypothetical protein
VNITDITKIDYDELRKQREAPYFVQWVTKFDSIKGDLEVVGYCVRRHKTWETVFQHKDYEVCVKVCEMLNENEEGA